MDILWSELNERLSWPIVNRILRDCDLPTKQGKVNTYNALTLLYNTSDNGKNKIEGLKEHLANAIYYRNKFIRYFDFTPDVIHQCLNRIQEDFSSFSPFTYGLDFPLMDNEDLIEYGRLNHPELIKIVKKEDQVYLIFSTIRQFKEKEDLRDRFNNIAGTDFVNDYSSVYGEIITHKQFFDIINIDSYRNIVEFRIDNYLDLSLKQLEVNYNQLLSAANMIFSGLPRVNFSVQSHNFYSMLKKIYDDENQGKVKEMAFITDSSSLKHEKLNYINDVDLRKDGYHENGKNGITGLDFYRLGLSWDIIFPRKNVIYMSILGKQHMLRFTDGAYINDAFVKECHCESEYYFILDLMQRYN